MYVLQPEATERNYLLSLLTRQHVSTATRLSARLRTADEVFGIAMWTEDDIASAIREQDIPDIPENIRAVRNSFYARHIDDRMVEHGWEVLEQAVSELNLTPEVPR